MKAQEYFDNYLANVKSREELDNNCVQMFRDFITEFETIKNARRVSTVDGIVGIVRELNDKWNAVANKAYAKYNTTIIRKNIIWNKCLSDQNERLWPRKAEEI
jgi:hypothetical protein